MADVRLSTRCRKEALKDPKGCATAASAAATKACAKVTRGRGSCMDTYYEKFLVEKCGNIVCPGDPFMLAEIPQSTISKTTVARAGEGGGFDSGGQDVVLKQEGGQLNIEQGMAASKMKYFLLAGIGVLVVLAMRKKS